jgi:hypothetical protein
MTDRTDLLVNLFRAHLDACREHLVAQANEEVANPAYDFTPAFNEDFDDTSLAIAKEFVDLVAAVPMFRRHGSRPATS